MQGTSANYAPYVDEIRTDALIEFELIDVDAAQTATPSVNIPAASFASLAQTHNRITQNSMKLATLEPNLWKLDGSYSLPNHVDNLETGYFSSVLSDADGNIDITLQYTFPHNNSSDGFTVIFDTKAEEIASEFTIKTYVGTIENGSYAVTGNKDVVKMIPMQSDAYNKVTVHFTKTAKPYRRIRVTEFVFGEVQQFKGNKIKEMHVLYECGLYMDKMPAGKMEVTIDNSDNAYNILNPTGIYRYLQEGQGLNASIIINGESVSMGRFYFDTASANDDNLTAKITAYDLLWRLDQTDYNGGATGTWTFAQAVAAIVADSGLVMDIAIPANIGARQIRKCIPPGASHREALRMAAQAAKTVLYFNRIGELRAKDFKWSNPVDELSTRRMRGYGEAKDNGLINNVILETRDNYSGEVYTYEATDRKSGEPLQTLKLVSPLAAGQDVAQWVLQCAKHRNTYNTPVQGNPARDIGDSITIANIYGDIDNAVVVKQETIYDGSVLDTIVAYGGVASDS